MRKFPLEVVVLCLYTTREHRNVLCNVNNIIFYVNKNVNFAKFMHDIVKCFYVNIFLCKTYEM